MLFIAAPDAVAQWGPETFSCDVAPEPLTYYQSQDRCVAGERPGDVELHRMLLAATRRRPIWGSSALAPSVHAASTRAQMAKFTSEAAGGRFADACDTDGTQIRRRTVCADGEAIEASQERSCTRPRPAGCDAADGRLSRRAGLQGRVLWLVVFALLRARSATRPAPPRPR